MKKITRVTVYLHKQKKNFQKFLASEMTKKITVILSFLPCNHDIHRVMLARSYNKHALNNGNQPSTLLDEPEACYKALEQ